MPPPSLTAIVIVVLAAVGVGAGELEDGCESTTPSWRLSPTGPAVRLVEHARAANSPHRGERCERVVVETGAPTLLTLETPLGPAAVIDEFRAAVWVRSSRPDLRLAVRVRLAGTAEPVEVLVPGTASRDIGRWELL